MSVRLRRSKKRGRSPLDQPSLDEAGDVAAGGDQVVGEALCDSVAMRVFVGIDLGVDSQTKLVHTVLLPAANGLDREAMTSKSLSQADVYRMIRRRALAAPQRSATSLRFLLR